MLSPLLMWNKIGRIVTIISKEMNISSEQALDMFYLSRTNELMRDTFIKLYTFSDKYLADEIIKENQK